VTGGLFRSVLLHAHLTSPRRSLLLPPDHAEEAFFSCSDPVSSDWHHK
jgi:hypothetical protein